MNFELQDTDTEGTFVLFDDLVSPQVIHFEEAIKQFVRNTTKDAVLDLEHVTRIDSIAIASMIRIKNQFMETGRHLQIINPNENVLKVLEIAGLDTYLFD